MIELTTTTMHGLPTVPVKVDTAESATVDELLRSLHDPRFGLRAADHKTQVHATPSHETCTIDESDNQDTLFDVSLAYANYNHQGASSPASCSKSKRFIQIAMTTIGKMMKSVLRLRFFCCCGASSFRDSEARTNEGGGRSVDHGDDSGANTTASVIVYNTNPFKEGIDFCDRIDAQLDQALAREYDVLEQLNGKCSAWSLT